MNLHWFDQLFSKHPHPDARPLLRRLRQGVLVFYALTLLIVLLAVAWISYADYQGTLRSAERQALSLARSLDEHATRSLVSVEQAMQNVAEDVERAGGMNSLDEHWAHERMKGKVELTPQIRAIIVMNSRGTLAAHGLEYPTRRVDLSDRAYFAYHRSHNDVRLRIGEPIISRTDYKWLIPLTRRINTADSQFDGVMLSGVEPDYFLRFYDSLQLERGTSIQLLRTDGVLLLNHPLDITQLGKNLRDNDSASFDALQLNRTAFFRDQSAEGDHFVAQLVSASSVPVIVRVKLDTERVLAKFVTDTRMRVALSSLILVALSLMLFVLLRQIRHVEESESRLQLTQFAMDESPEMILWCDSGGHLQYANRRLAEVSQFSASELLSMGFGELIGDSEQRWEQLENTLRIVGRQSQESVLRCKNGQRVPLELTAARISDKHRHYLCITARDISERLAAEEELRRHRDHLQEMVTERTAEVRTVLDANPLAIVLSVQEHMQLVNPAFEALFGYGMSSINGLPERLIHASEESYSQTRRAIENRVALGGTYRGEAELRRSDGSMFWAMLFARALVPNEPERGLVFIIEDVTAQRTAALALRQSEQLKRSVLDTTADSFALIDRQRRFVDVNQALCLQLGISRGALLGQTPEAVWGEAIAGRLFPQDDKQLSATARREIILPIQDGQRHPFMVSYGLIPDDRGETEYVFAFLSDISRQKEIEKTLLEAKEAAEAASHAKSTFLTNMSHELRTPMHAILSFSEMGLHKSGANEASELARYFERIQNAGKRLLALLNDLLDMSRLEADKMSYDKARHYLQNTVQAAIAEVSSLTMAKALSLLNNDSYPRLLATYDKARLTQVLINLLSNAIKFSPAKSSIEIDYLSEADPVTGQPVVGLTVRDHGPGIPEGELELIFDSFEQSSKAPSPGGTGLGLTISRRIMLDHGGSICAANHPDGGAVFTIRLPAEAPSPALTEHA
ncbi:MULTISPECIES: PAS domain S-box protein [unclassified Uliginosibacterium]|uniref:PAS domain S-box protein n=1 Tax=unclassified Uliginosibacterium TaxID=2621521 RepID=UPI000C7ACDCF|nr:MULTISPECIES: PAS domain S-box protein [unclassified Uliginosibacterium]MDO6385919.1 PAS domain S-box protein [Uliginosibacterium sp. 31-12]PLK49930.1 hypothetical protein C0V76_05810 [Uliginosibacterium sp. TH139]